MKLETLLQELNYHLIGARDKQVTGLCYDSRKAEKGSLYACLPGTKTDGHQFIPQALEKGATSILCQEH